MCLNSLVSGDRLPLQVVEVIFCRENLLELTIVSSSRQKGWVKVPSFEFRVLSEPRATGPILNQGLTDELKFSKAKGKR